MYQSNSNLKGRSNSFTALFILSFFFLSMQGYGQQSRYVGQVVDAQRGTPLPKAVIRLEEGHQTWSSDNNGVFAIEQLDSSAVLLVTYIGYISQRIPAAEFQNKDLLRIWLEPEPDLDPLTVESSIVEQAFPDRTYSVLDYELLDTAMILMLRRGSRYVLKWINDSLKQLDRVEFNKSRFRLSKEQFKGGGGVDKFLLKESRCLYKNFKGDIHLISSDVVNEIYFQPDRITFFPRVRFDEFATMILPMVAKLSARYYMVSFQRHNQQVVYTMIDSVSGSTATHSVTDVEGVKQAHHWWSRSFWANRHHTIEVMDVWKEHLAVMRPPRKAMGVYNQIAHKPLNCPLFQSRDSLYLLDHVQGKLLVFDDGFEVARSAEVSHHKDKGFQDRVHVDMVTEAVYLEYRIKNHVYLSRLDLNTGQIVSSTQLEDHPYPEKIRIRNGYAYYIYKKKGEMAKRYLYKQRLRS